MVVGSDVVNGGGGGGGDLLTPRVRDCSANVSIGDGRFYGTCGFKSWMP